jgi:hypothetical protein
MRDRDGASVEQFRAILGSTRIDFEPLWNDHLGRTGGFAEHPEQIQMYHVLLAVKDGIGKLPQYRQVHIDIPLEMVGTTHSINCKPLSSIVGKIISRQELYEFRVALDGPSVNIYFSAFSADAQAGVDVPLRFKDADLSAE